MSSDVLVVSWLLARTALGEAAVWEKERELAAREAVPGKLRPATDDDIHPGAVVWVDRKVKIVDRDCGWKVFTAHDGRHYALEVAEVEV